MKRFFVACFSIITLFSCENESKPLSEDFNAICFVNNGEEISLGNGTYMRTPKIDYILFTYHDSVFQVLNNETKSTFYYLKLRKNGKDSLLSVFKTYTNTSLNKQLKTMTRETTLGSYCAPEGYFLVRNNDKLNFGIFHYDDFNTWHRKFRYKEITLKPAQVPKIYQTIYHSLNSKNWDYFMSDDYYYRDVRTYQKIQFIEPENP